MKLSSLAALDTVKMITTSVASDKNLIKMTFSLQWEWWVTMVRNMKLDIVKIIQSYVKPALTTASQIIKYCSG